MPLSTIEEALEDIRQGRPVIVVDDDTRESEGSLVLAAEMVTADAIDLMAREGRGPMYVPLTGRRLDDLQIPLLRTEDHIPGASVTVDARRAGARRDSAAGRAATVLALTHPGTRASDLMRPGHIAPIRTEDGGVLRSPGRAEAAVDLARAAGLQPAAMTCEIACVDGPTAERFDLQRLADRNGFKRVSVAQLISYRQRHEHLVRRVTPPVSLPTAYGVFDAIGYVDVISDAQHMAIVKGPLTPDVPTLVRVHSECLTGDAFGSHRCDCGEQLQQAMRMIDKDGGVIVYMRSHEGRGIGLHNKLRAYKLQEEGLDTVEANVRLGFPPDMRDFGVGREILRDLGLRRVRLMTNNPEKAERIFGPGQAREHGLELVETVPIQVTPNEHNIRYLETKRSKMGHTLELRDGSTS